jgi:uncharacterized membrane protein
MRILNNPWVSGAVVVACIAVIYLANTGAVFGKFINRFYPCTDTTPGGSMPCYGKYDIVIMVLAAIIGFVFFVFLLRNLLLASNAK